MIGALNKLEIMGDIDNSIICANCEHTAYEHRQGDYINKGICYVDSCECMKFIEVNESESD